VVWVVVAWQKQCYGQRLRAVEAEGHTGGRYWLGCAVVKQENWQEVGGCCLLGRLVVGNRNVGERQVV
jgi:hypothetical protein